MQLNRISGKRSLNLRGTVLIGLVAPLLAGCDLLEIQAPNRLPADEVVRAENAEVLVEGAVSNFECAFANYVIASGEIGDELVLRARTKGGRPGYDRRDYEPESPYYSELPCRGADVFTYNDNIGVYTPVQTARRSADDALEVLQETATDGPDRPQQAELIAKAAAYSGYSHLLLGEGFCSAAIDLGPELSRAEVFERAEGKFSEAIEAGTSAGTGQIVNMAHVGRARARLNLGRYQEARTDAEQVPRGFVINANYSGTAVRTENRVFTENLRDFQNSVGPMYHDLQYEGVEDTRVPVFNTGLVSGSRQDTVWGQELYVSEGSPIPIAKWEEAKLIIAEAKLREGDVAGFVDDINDLHRDAGLPEYSTTDPDEAMDHLIQERRRALFLDGHHLQDLIRFDLPLIPAPGTPYEGGGVYGDMTCMPLPEIEKANNPNIG